MKSLKQVLDNHIWMLVLSISTIFISPVGLKMVWWNYTNNEGRQWVSDTMVQIFRMIGALKWVILPFIAFYFFYVGYKLVRYLFDSDVKVWVRNLLAFDYLVLLGLSIFSFFNPFAMALGNPFFFSDLVPDTYERAGYFLSLAVIAVPFSHIFLVVTLLVLKFAGVNSEEQELFEYGQEVDNQPAYMTQDAENG